MEREREREVAVAKSVGGGTKGREGVCREGGREGEVDGGRKERGRSVEEGDREKEIKQRWDSA